MKIPLSRMKPPKSRSIRLVTPFPKTKEFVLGLVWLSKTTRLTLPKLLYWTNNEDTFIVKRYHHERVKDDDYIMNEHDRETRAWLSFLLRVLGYSELEIFTYYFADDFPFRHLPYHEEWNGTLKQDADTLTRHWSAITIGKTISKLGGKDIVGQAIRWFNKRYP